MKEKEHSEKHEHKVKKHRKLKIKIPKIGKIGVPTAIVIILLIISILTGGFGLSIGAMSKAKATEKALDYVNSNLLQAGNTATVLETSVQGDLYMIKLDIDGKEYDSYVTKDGKIFFPSGMELEKTEETTTKEATATQPTAQVPAVDKSDKPDIKLFIMSYCPYGLQALKALIPAQEALKDVADIKLHFVHYAMHGKKEMDENTRMYCIQKEDPAKFWDYLTEFVQTDDPEGAMSKAGISKSKIDSCMASADTEFGITAAFDDQASWLSGRFPIYNIDKTLAEQYGVKGSPTTVINDKVVSVSRSPEGYRAAICAAFNTEPSVCKTALSSDSPPPGIGVLESAANVAKTDATCG